MREIKFRAWDKDREKIIEWQSLIDYCDIDYLFGNIGENPKRDTVPDFEVMQYTGLKDKNGVEIYEGDIVIKDSYTEIAVVEYYSLCCNYTLNDTLLSLTAGMATNYFEGEVIGNIYENPELLEASK